MQTIHSSAPRESFLKREIWWAALGVNIGTEEDGTGVDWDRPVLIIKGLSYDSCLIAPLTTSLSTHPFRVPIGVVQGKQASVILSQIRVIDTKRLLERIGFLGKGRFREVNKTLRALL